MRPLPLAAALMGSYLSNRAFATTSPSLKVTRVKKEEVESLKKTLADWRLSSDCLYETASIEEERVTFSDLSHIASRIEFFLEHYFLEEPSEGQQVLICKDKEDPSLIQAIGVIGSSPSFLPWDKQETIRIRYLVTNPHNVRSKLNETSTKKVKGAASSILFYAYDKCLEENCREIRLYSTKSAESFYSKCGMQKQTSHPHDDPHIISQKGIKAKVNDSNT